MSGIENTQRSSRRDGVARDKGHDPRGAHPAYGNAAAFVASLLTAICAFGMARLFSVSTGDAALADLSFTVVTFAIVFLIQRRQYKDMRAVHLKLDELIVALEGPRDHLAGLEHDDDARKALESGVGGRG